MNLQVQFTIVACAEPLGYVPEEQTPSQRKFTDNIVLMKPSLGTENPPSFDGKTLLSAFEDGIDDRELDEDKRGPALRNRLEGDATI